MHRVMKFLTSTLRKYRLQALKHAARALPNGGSVLVLNRGAIVTAEDEAMLQALHSRSVGGIKSHIKKLAHSGSGGLMKNFYVGYGHKSIGDCGTVTIFIEGVSMLAAKAIQDWRLYSGQEASTRYVDFGTQRFLNPAETDAGARFLETLRAFYLRGLPLVKEHVMGRHPYKKEWNAEDYRKTVNARAFDIMRGFLPAGATTNLAWTSNLRQIADKLMYLRHHPLSEIRAVAEAIESAVQEFLPNSFGHKRYEQTEEYNKQWMQSGYYYESGGQKDFAASHGGIDRELLASYKKVLASRPPKTELPREIAECGTIQLEFLLDFGSFRDIQRHRAVVQRMPLHTTRHGFHPWYIGELGEGFAQEAEKLLGGVERALSEITQDKFLSQYYIPMGYLMPNRLTGDLHALTYLAELRGTRFVHPTLRQRAYQIAGMLEKEFGPYGLALHLDDNPDAFDVKRGQQDIVEKKKP